MTWKNVRQRVGLWLFDGMLIILTTAVLIVGTELVLRGLLAMQGKPFTDASVVVTGQRLDWGHLNRGTPSEKRPVTDAYKDFQWVSDYLKEARRVPDPGLVYEPFSLWKHAPYQTPYVTYQNNGYRRTVNPVKNSFKKKYTVFVFGGSTIAGDGLLRDEDLIPSCLSEILNRRSPDVFFEVYNYGQSGFNQGNEVVLLVRLLTDGQRPDVVLFYDGVNDVIHRVGYGEPHMSYSFFQKGCRFFSYTIKDTLRMWFITGLRNKSALFRSLVPEVEDPRAQEVYLTGDPNLIKKRSAEVGDFYAGNMELVDALSKHYRFQYLLVLQPTLFTKRLKSPEETLILKAVRANAASLEQIFTVAYPMIQERFQDQKDHSFADMADLYQDSSVSMYVDPAHVSPKGNLLAAQCIAHECFHRKIVD